MKAITRSNHAAKHVSQLLTFVIAALVPLGAYAQSPPTLSTTANGSVLGGSYYNSQNSSTEFVLQDSSAMGDGQAYYSLRLVDSYGGATVAASTGAIGGFDFGGHGYAFTGTDSTDYVTVFKTAEVSATIIVRFHVSGNITGGASGVGIGGSEGYSAGACVNDACGGATGTLGVSPAGGGWTGTPVSAVGTFIVTSGIGFGNQAFNWTQSTRLTANADSNGTGESSASLSGSFSLRCVGYTILDDQNNPIPYTLQSNMGWGRGDVLASGDSFANLSLTNGAPGGFGSTVTMRDGVASAIRNVFENFVAPPHDLVLASDMVDVSGTETDPVTVQVSYDPNSAQALFGGEEFMRLVWENPVTNELLNAVAGNNGGAAKFIKGAYNAATDFQLGNYGIDTIANVVWAVVNHNSEFAVAHVEPVPLYLTKFSKAAGNHKVIDGFGIPLKTYEVQSTTNLAQAFTDLAPATVAANGVVQFDEVNSSARGFYRVVAQ